MPTFNYSRVRPVDLLEVATDQGANTTISAAIAAIQANGNLTKVCPKCQDQNGTPTGWNTVKTSNGTVKVMCTVCLGNLKTIQTYMPDPTSQGNYVALLISGPVTSATNAHVQLSCNVSGGAWSSATPATATINALSGIITTVAAGKSVITYTIGEYSTSVEFTVTNN